MSRAMRFLRRNYMVDTFFKLKGNARSCIWTEPLWGVPFNLYAPFVTLYMYALGLDAKDVGIIATISYISQAVASLFSGVLTDKLGRRWCTLIVDFLSWSVPEILWACSQNFTWFVVAALFNGLWKITDNSWSLLLVEDTPHDQIVPVFSLASFMGVIATFIAPLSKFAVDAFSLVTTMRFLYALAFVSMTVKFVILFFYSHETTVGKKRLELTKGVSIFRSLYECKDVYLKIIREKRMLFTMLILAAYSLINTVNGNVWAIYVVNQLGIRESDISWFSMIKGGITLLAILALVPRLKSVSFKRPMLLSISTFAFSQASLLALGLFRAPMGVTWPALVVCVGLDAMSMSLLGPLTSSLLFFHADPEERARVNGMVFATISLMVCAFPFLIGWLANKSLYIPFCINLALFGAIGALTVFISRIPREDAVRGEAA